MKKLLALALSGLLVATAAYMLRGTSIPPFDVAIQPANGKGAENGKVVAPSSVVQDGRQSIRRAEVRHGDTIFSGLPQSRHGLALDGDPFVAESVEEQKWLDRNGYPNAQQWAAYRSATDGQLAHAAANGDKLARVFADARALSTGDQDAANRLMKAAEEGSLFALNMLEAHMAGASNGNGSLAYSLNRVIEMMGNSRISLTREFSPNIASLSPTERMLAEADARLLFEKLKSTSARENFVDPRPSWTPLY